ncbi:MAG: FAD-binding protein, partial [Anaerolineaceae bacterium]
MHEIHTKTAALVDINQVKCISGFENIKNEFPSYLSDESKLSAEPFELLFFPKNEAELAAVIREMRQQKVKLTFAGARTGLVGGCVPQEGALVSLEFLDKVEAIYHEPQAEEWRICAQTSVSLKALENM